MVHDNWPQLPSELEVQSQGHGALRFCRQVQRAFGGQQKKLHQYIYLFWQETPVEMANKKEEILGCDFEIRGKVPKEAFELFAVAQAKTLGLRGFITQVSEEKFKGRLEGEGKVIDAFKKLILAAAEYVQAIKEFIIKNLKVIQEYTYKTFEIKVEQK
nr:acylphosphatase-1 [Drosophila suzukii]